MIRIRHILDPDLRRRIVEALALRRGCSTAAIPEWFELDDADYVDLLNDLKEESDESSHDSRMQTPMTRRNLNIIVISLVVAGVVVIGWVTQSVFLAIVALAVFATGILSGQMSRRRNR